jgi:membrane-bound serine protease (ClpP class)
LAGLFLLGGFLLIIGDFFTEGFGLAALGGIVLLAVFFWGHMLAGLAGWEDVALVVLGIALLAVEIFIFPGFGVAGVLGLVSLGTGAFLSMVYRDFDFVTSADVWRSAVTVGSAILLTLAGFIFLFVAMSRRGGPAGLVLTSSSGATTTSGSRTASGWLRWFGSEDRLESDRLERPGDCDTGTEQSMVGLVGVAVSDLRPGGIVMINERRIDAVTTGEYIPAGEEVEVVLDERYRRVVRRRQ